MSFYKMRSVEATRTTVWYSYQSVIVHLLCFLRRSARIVRPYVPHLRNHEMDELVVEDKKDIIKKYTHAAVHLRTIN